MSLLSDVMQDARGIINDALGNLCTLTNTNTKHAIDTRVIIQHDVELYQDKMFAGIVSTAVFNLAECNPLVGNELKDKETGTSYVLDGIKTITTTKAEFILRELS